MPQPKNALPCFVCGQELDLAVPLRETELPHNQPSGGLALETRGHYGSTVFDPMQAGRTLEIAVCDGCMVGRWARTRQVKRTPRTEESVIAPPGLSYEESAGRD